MNHEIRAEFYCRPIEVSITKQEKIKMVLSMKPINGLLNLVRDLIALLGAHN
jgi:hypothetical protein